ncbi:MAG: hypothetical protein AAB909_04960 [Patescibacteria group bacterium]
MAVRQIIQNPYETIEGIAKAAAKPVKKAVSDTVKAAVSDVKGDLGIETQTTSSGQANQQAKSDHQTTKAQEDQKSEKLLSETRNKLEELNAKIKRAREERERKTTILRQAQDKEAQKKKYEEQKKDNDPIWKKMLKGKQGSRESNMRGGG